MGVSSDTPLGGAETSATLGGETRGGAGPETAGGGPLSRALDVPSTNDRPRVDRDAGRLVGSRCRACGTSSWPARAICHRCGSPDQSETQLSPEGTVITFTTVWVPRPGLEPPYILGQVDLPEGVRVFAHLRELGEDTVVPFGVTLVMASEEDAVPPFWFQPLEAS